MTQDGEVRILDAIGRVSGQVDDLDGKVDRTREDQAALAASQRGQERQLERIGDRLEREQEERRKAIGKVTERVVRVEGNVATLERLTDADTTGRQSALTPADAAVLAPPPAPRIHSIRSMAAGRMEVEKWKAIAAIGVPLALAVAGWVAHLYR